MRLPPALVVLLGLVSGLAQGVGGTENETGSPDDPTLVHCFGKAWTSDGKPWKQAQIWFELTLPLESEQWSPGRPVSATTDAKGRFRVQLRPDRQYLVYAHSPLSGVRGWRFSAPMRFQPLNRLVTLREEGRTRPHIDLLVSGLQAFEKEWQASGPLRYRILGSSGLMRPLQLEGNKPVPLPAWPDEDAEVQVVDKDGCILYRHAFPLSGEARDYRAEDLAARKEQQALAGSRYLPGLDAEDPLPRSDQERLVLPHALMLEVQLLDKADGKPLPGAELVAYDRSDFAGKPRPFKTDEQGRVRMRVPHQIYPWGQYRQPSTFDFLARVPGYEHCLAHFEFRLRRARMHFAFDKLFAKEVPVVRCSLGKGLRYHGSLLLPPGSDASSIRMRAWSSGPLPRSDDWVSFVRQPSMHIQPKADGRFEMGGLSSDPESIRIDMLLPADLRRRLGASQDDSIPTQEGLSLRIDRIRNLEADYKDKPLDLTALAYRDVLIRTSKNEPASHASLDLQSYPNRDFRLQGKRYLARTRVHCDRRGRCRLLLPKGSFRLLVLTADEYGYLESDREELAANAPWRLGLKPKLTQAGRIVDANGQPVPGAWIYPTQRMTKPTDEGIPRGHEGLDEANLLSMETRTDAEGRFVVRYLPLKNEAWMLSASREFPSRKKPRVRFRLPPEEETTQVELVLK